MVNVGKRLSRLAAVLACVLIGAAGAALGQEKGPDFQGIPSVMHDVTAPDGARLKVFELAGNEGSDKVILLMHGFLESGKTLDGAAAEYHARGYKVVVGQYGLAGKGEFRSTGGVGSGLEESLVEQYPAVIRKAIEIAGPARKLDIFGHSWGGLGALATMSDPKLAAELGPHIGAITAANSPVGFMDLSLSMRAMRPAVATFIPVLKQARAVLDRESLDPVGGLFDLLQRLKSTENTALRKSAAFLERRLLQLTRVVLGRTLIDVDHVSSAALERMLRQELSDVPLDVLIGFMQAFVDGQFRGADGRLLVDPSRIKSDVQLISAEDDVLAPRASLRKFFAKLGSPVKRLVQVEGTKHVSIVVSDNPAANVLPEVINFHDAPAASAARAPVVTLSPGPPGSGTFTKTEQSAALDCPTSVLKLLSGRLNLLAH